MLRKIFKALDVQPTKSQKNPSTETQVDDNYVRTIMGASDMGTCGYNEQAYFDKPKQQEPKQKRSPITEEETYDLTLKTLNPFS